MTLHAKLLSVAIIVAAFWPIPAVAQVHAPGPSDSALFDKVINLPPHPNLPFIIGGITGETTQLNISDAGFVRTGFVADKGSEVNISGGTVGESIHARAGSEVNISGGTVGHFFKASASVVSISGGEFMLNGSPYTDDNISLDCESSSQCDVLSGTLADGSAFIFSRYAGDSLADASLTTVPLPSLDTTPIVVTCSDTRSTPSGLRKGQTLTLRDRGRLQNFEVVHATLIIDGGHLSGDSGVVGGVVSMSDGSIRNGAFSIFPSGTVNISGGITTSRFLLSADSELNISGGIVDLSFADFVPGSQLNISGGTVRDLRFFSGSVAISGGLVSGFEPFVFSGAEISGGTIDGSIRGRSVNITGGDILGDVLAKGGDVTLSGGRVHGTLGARNSGGVNLIGTDFIVDGIPLDDLVQSEWFTIESRGTVSGVFADGTPFDFDLRAGDFASPRFTSLRVMLVPEPGAQIIFFVATAFVSRRRRDDDRLRRKD